MEALPALAGSWAPPPPPPPGLGLRAEGTQRLSGPRPKQVGFLLPENKSLPDNNRDEETLNYEATRRHNCSF